MYPTTPTLSVEAVQLRDGRPPDSVTVSVGVDGATVSTLLAMVQAKFAVTLVKASRAVTVTLKVPAALGVPVILPVVAAIVSPVGRPVALYVNASPSGSLATMASVTAVPCLPLWLPGLVITGGGLAAIVQVKLAGTLTVASR